MDRYVLLKLCLCREPLRKVYDKYDGICRMDRCDYDGRLSMSIVGHLGKSMETLRRGVSDRYDGHAG